MLRYEASVSSAADASCLSMTVYLGLLHQKVFALLSGLETSDFAGNETSKAQNLAKAEKYIYSSVAKANGNE
ncbi:hypothetical protein [Pedobacter sp.]|uniref:hypothetical protein n=1 Tax=Pedobacter sp. TaxID=1411316 RepID=UPI003C4C6DDD